VLKKIVLEKTSNPIIQFFRYFFAGGIAYIFDFGTLTLLTFFKFFQNNYVLAATIAFIPGLICNYILSILWVFKTRNIKNPIHEFGIFAIIGMIGLILNDLFMWFFGGLVFKTIYPIINKQIRILASKIPTTILVYLWNFFAKKLFLFRDSKSKE